MIQSITKSLRVMLAALLILPLLAPAVMAQESSYIFMAKPGKMDQAMAAVRAAGGDVIKTIPEVRVIVTDAQPESFYRSLRGNSNVQHLSPNYEMQLDVPEHRQLSNPPNSGDDDALFDLQWGADAIDLPEAWSTGYDGSGVRVAVIDSGIDRTHPDLAPNLNGWCSASFVPGEPYWNPPGLYFDHGSHVAGIIAAPDNGLGTIGVAPGAEICAIKIFSFVTGGTQFDWIIDAIVHAVNVDADVINMSFGLFAPKAAQFQSFLNERKAIYDALAAYANANGTTMIAAAGNDGSNLSAGWEALPAEAKNVLAISASAPENWATDPGNIYLDTPASYTNFGASAIFVGAPGGDFDGSGANCTVIGITRPCWLFDMVISPSPGSWFWAAGTSMAAPHAAGVVALMKDKWPGASPTFLRERLKKTADDKAALYFGKNGGRVNAYRALTQSRGPEADDGGVLAIDERPQTMALEQNYPNPFNPTTTINYQLNEQSAVYIAVFDMLGREVKTLVNATLEAGIHSVEWDGRDGSGRAVASGVYMYQMRAGNFMETQTMMLAK